MSNSIWEGSQNSLYRPLEHRHSLFLFFSSSSCVFTHSHHLDKRRPKKPELFKPASSAQIIGFINRVNLARHLYRMEADATVQLFYCTGDPVVQDAA